MVGLEANPQHWENARKMMPFHVQNYEPIFWPWKKTQLALSLWSGNSDHQTEQLSPGPRDEEISRLG